MYSVYQRLTNTSSWAMSVCLALLAAISLTSWLTLAAVEPGYLALQSFQVLPQKGGRFENGVIQMDVQSDLTPLFANWNTKQLYVSIVAEWNNTKTKTASSMIVWDRIVERKRKSRGNLKLSGLRPKYPWMAAKGTFGHVDSVRLSLHYDMMPYVGIVTPGIAAQARNPDWNGTATSTGIAMGEWDIALPRKVAARN